MPPNARTAVEGRRRPDGWRFDFEAADAAARQLELTAQALLEAVAEVERDVAVAADEWRGRFREVFDVESGRHVAGGRLLADDLVAMAAQVRAQAVLAAAAWEAEQP